MGKEIFVHKTARDATDVKKHKFPGRIVSYLNSPGQFPHRFQLSQRDFRNIKAHDLFSLCSDIDGADNSFAGQKPLPRRERAAPPARATFAAAAKPPPLGHRFLGSSDWETPRRERARITVKGEKKIPFEKGIKE
jgi:hypothetical protein